MSRNSRLEMLKAMLKDNAEDTFLRYAFSLETAALGNLSEGVEMLKKIRKNNPEYLPLYYQLGQWLEQLEDFKGAEEAYSEGISLALSQKNMKILNELRNALSNLNV